MLLLIFSISFCMAARALSMTASLVSTLSMAVCTAVAIVLLRRPLFVSMASAMALLYAAVRSLLACSRAAR